MKMHAPKLQTNVAGTDGLHRPRPMLRSGLVLALLAVLGIVVGSFATLTFPNTSPVPTDTGLVFEVPYGTQSIVPAGLQSAINFPTVIRFKPGETARITLINHDSVRHLIGPYLVDAGATLVLSFPNPGVFPVDCSINYADSITVIVEE